jgi:serine/threonine-protein kinase
MAPEPSADNGGLVALLGFIAGVLVVGVGGGLAWLWLHNGQLGNIPAISSSDRANPQPSSPTPTDSPAFAPPTAPDLDSGELNRAIASVQQLYNNLSLGNLQEARQLFSGSAADQFDPVFFRQFQRVSVDDLREISHDGSAIELQGVVTFVYPDGSTQSESRSFTVDTSTDPALITASSFGQVLQGRH